MSVVVGVNVVVRCPICEGKGGECPMCKGEGHQNVNMPLEAFARLFETCEELHHLGKGVFKSVPLVVSPPESDE